MERKKERKVRKEVGKEGARERSADEASTMQANRESGMVMLAMQTNLVCLKRAFACWKAGYRVSRLLWLQNRQCGRAKMEDDCGGVLVSGCMMDEVVYYGKGIP